MGGEFDGKVALVTGGASGIGFATVERLMRDDARVVLVDRDEARANDALGRLPRPSRAAAWACACDVSNEADVARAMAQTVDRFGAVDVVVNNAGVMVFKELADHTEEDWIRVLSVDLLGAFFFTREAFRRMKKGGAIVNVSSVHAVETTPLVAAYAAAKAALVSLTHTAAIEGKPKGIRVNAVLPGAVDTPMLWENPNIKSGLEVVKKTDVGEPEDIADAIAYLASDRAAFIRGAALRVDGGRLARL
jgi:NAD(P)-dependent dehydrogenase (short-subunit alcohol dehydrogenase family)